ncbi:MAG: hypothetical protein ACP5KZ_08570 [bacterium]
MERRLHSALYLIQISLLLLVAGCGGKREVQPTIEKKPREKVEIALSGVHFLQNDAKGRKLMEIWASSSKGEEDRIELSGVKTILYEKGEPFAELLASSAVYEPKSGFLILDKGGNLRGIKRASDITCGYLEVFFKGKRVKGRNVTLKWGKVSLQGREFSADWGLKRGMLKNGAIVKIEFKRRQKR